MEKETRPMGGEQVNEEVVTPKDINRFQDLESQGFTKHFFDDSIDAHREQFHALIDEANEKGWQKETIIKGRHIYVYTKES